MNSDRSATDTITLEYHVIPCNNQAATDSNKTCSAVKTALGCYSAPWLIALILLVIASFLLIWLKLRRTTRHIDDTNNGATTPAASEPQPPAEVSPPAESDSHDMPQ
jgi:hypothetical protein